MNTKTIPMLGLSLALAALVGMNNLMDYVSTSHAPELEHVVNRYKDDLQELGIKSLSTRLERGHRETYAELSCDCNHLSASVDADYDFYGFETKINDSGNWSVEIPDELRTWKYEAVAEAMDRELKRYISAAKKEVEKNKEIKQSWEDAKDEV